MEIYESDALVLEIQWTCSIFWSSLKLINRCEFVWLCSILFSVVFYFHLILYTIIPFVFPISKIKSPFMSASQLFFTCMFYNRIWEYTRVPTSLFLSVIMFTARPKDVLLSWEIYYTRYWRTHHLRYLFIFGEFFYNRN